MLKTRKYARFFYMCLAPNWIMNPFRAEILYIFHVLSQGLAC